MEVVSCNVPLLWLATPTTSAWNQKKVETSCGFHWVGWLTSQTLNYFMNERVRDNIFNVGQRKSAILWLYFSMNSLSLFSSAELMVWNHVCSNLQTIHAWSMMHCILFVQGPKWNCVVWYRSTSSTNGMLLSWLFGQRTRCLLVFLSSR